MSTTEPIDGDPTRGRPQSEGPILGEVVTGHVGARARRHWDVLVGERSWKCSLRGKLLGQGVSPLVGDRVRFRVAGPGEGTIEEILPRRNVLSRQVGEGRRAKRHLYCANVELVVVVSASSAPAFRPALIDRLLITACYEGLAPVVCLNKIDLDRDGEAVRAMDVYRAAGYEVFLTSAITGEGIEDLAGRLTGHICVFSGHSGVGKTTILKRIVPGFSRQTQDVSKRARGRHSTTEVYLVGLPSGGYIVDTPGFREFTVWGVAPEDIASYYPEFLPYASKCRFHNCLHHEDPDCAVREAVENGKISYLRYRNYLRILETHGGG